MKVLYFAWLKEKVGMAHEDLALPDGVRTVHELVDHLRDRGEGFADAFGDESIVRVAVNHEHVEHDHVLADGDEVAFFPPVTGG